MENKDDPDKGENLFVQHKLKAVANKNYLLLNNQSTVNQVANLSLLKNIGNWTSQILYTATWDQQKKTL
jgi:hypothetical protein